MSGFDVDVYFSSEESIQEFSKWTVQCPDIRCTDGWYWRDKLYKIISNIDTNIRVCFLTGYDINASDYPDLPENKTKIGPKPVYLTQLLEIINTLLNDSVL